MSTRDDLEAELATLRERLTALEARLGEAPPPVPTRKLTGTHGVLFVEVRQLAAAISVDAVKEVVPAAMLAPLPEAPPWLLGTLNLRGLTVPVLDVAARMGQSAPELRPSDVIVVVATERATAGLVVSEVGAIREVPLDAAPVLSDTRHAAYVVGTFVFAERARLLLGIQELLQVVDLPRSVDDAEEVA